MIVLDVVGRVRKMGRMIIHEPECASVTIPIGECSCPASTAELPRWQGESLGAAYDHEDGEVRWVDVPGGRLYQVHIREESTEKTWNNHEGDDDPVLTEREVSRWSDPVFVPTQVPR